MMKSALRASVFVMILLGSCSVRAGESLSFRQHLPAYVGTNYSTSESWQKEDAPYLQAQASLAMGVMKHPFNVGPASIFPELAFTWRAVNWPVGAFSSPILENNYMPEAYLRINEDDSGLFRGARVGWLHSSTGTDSSSGSIDRALLETKFAKDFIAGDVIVSFTGYVRGWYTIATGAETSGIEGYINFIGKTLISEKWVDSFWKDAGGELMVVMEIEDVIRIVASAGMTYQDYEIYIPLAAAYDVDLFIHGHNGYGEGILAYDDRHTSGGVGIAIVR